MSLTEHVDWFRTVAASCRRVEQLFLDQEGVGWRGRGSRGGRERLRRVHCARMCVCANQRAHSRNTAIF